MLVSAACPSREQEKIMSKTNILSITAIIIAAVSMGISAVS